jgi:hypothetical protein
MTNCSILNSYAETGGGLYISAFNENFLIESCKYINNTASNEGGGIASFTHTMRIVLTEFLYNNANVAGAGTFSSTLPTEGTVHFDNCTVAHNVADYGSGGFGIYSLNEVIISHCQVFGNVAEGKQISTEYSSLI